MFNIICWGSEKINESTTLHSRPQSPKEAEALGTRLPFPQSASAQLLTLRTVKLKNARGSVNSGTALEAAREARMRGFGAPRVRTEPKLFDDFAVLRRTNYILIAH